VVVVTATQRHRRDHGVGETPDADHRRGHPPGEAAYRFDLNDGRSIVADVDATTTRLALFEGDDVIGISRVGPAAPTFTRPTSPARGRARALLGHRARPDRAPSVTGTTSATGTLARRSTPGSTSPRPPTSSSTTPRPGSTSAPQATS
jgi:hypothetical protein